MTDQAYETPGVLDLSGADTSLFEAVDGGVYRCSIWEPSWTATKDKPGAKMPAGTPMFKIEWRMEDEPNVNRRQFTNFFPIKAAAPYDQAKAAKLQGAFVKLLIDLGYPEAEVKSPGFVLDLEGMKKREAMLVIEKVALPKSNPDDPTEYTNNVKGVKPVGSAAAGATTASAGLL